MTREEFLQRAEKVHHGKYEYPSLPEKLTNATKIVIVCNEKYPWGEIHGETIVGVGKHLLRGDGCTKCSGRYKRTKEDFVKEATFLHGGAYTYDDFDYVDTNTKGKIHCVKHNHDFMMSPNKHLDGQGCPICRYEKSSQKNTKTVEDFICEANKCHNGRYDYSKVEYVNNKTNVCIICPEHGEFWQTPNNHIHKVKPQGCPVCGRAKSDVNRRLTQEEFVERCDKIHDGRYDYSVTKYETLRIPIEINCRKHGVFRQIPYNHIMGEGCPKCGFGRSEGEKELFEWLSQYTECKNNDRTVLDGDEIDIVCPQKHIGVEYNGLYWHSEVYKDINYHLHKSLSAAEKGYRIIHIFEDEWNLKKDIVKSRLRNILGMTDKTIYARKCSLKKIDNKDAKEFMDANHLQGRCQCQVSYGLYAADGELVSVMMFGKCRHFIGNGKGEYELLRFANKADYSVVGGASRLLKAFVREYHPMNIISYADRRWSDGHLYETLGFVKYNESRPNYFYIQNQKRINRFVFRKSELVKMGFDSNKTEKEIMKDRGIPRIYDCGCFCYRKKFEWGRN